MKRTRRTTLIAAMISLISLALVGSTLAYLFSATDPVVNQFSPGDLDVEIDEEFTPPTESQGAAPKKARVQNTGKIDAFIRVMIVPTFRDGDKSYAGNVDYSTVGSGIIRVTGPDNETTYTLNLASGWSGKWFYANGAFYHTDPVPPGGYTTYFLDSVDRAGDGGWQGLEIEILCDAVQAAGTVEVALAGWDCTFNDTTNTIGP